jgi:hypothetical protein
MGQKNPNVTLDPTKQVATSDMDNAQKFQATMLAATGMPLGLTQTGAATIDSQLGRPMSAAASPTQPTVAKPNVFSATLAPSPTAPPVASDAMARAVGVSQLQGDPSNPVANNPFLRRPMQPIATPQPIHVIGAPQPIRVVDTPLPMRPLLPRFNGGLASNYQAVPMNGQAPMPTGQYF